jgi:hypothetical protein
MPVFAQRCGLRPDSATLRWWDWYHQWFAHPRTWVDVLEDELQAYDEAVADVPDEELRGHA